VSDDREFGVLYPAEARYLSFVYNVQTGSGAQRSSSIMRTRGCYLGDVGRGCEADLSLLSSAEVKKGGTIQPLPQTSSWRVV
jgi:hypothetical protein